MGKNSSVPSRNVDSTTQSEGTSGLGMLVRLLWMLIGPAVAVMVVVQIFTKRADFGKYDIAFWCLVLLMLAVRYADMRFLNGRTGTGEPATPQNYRVYAIRLLAITVIGWVALHGYALLGR